MEEKNDILYSKNVDYSSSKKISQNSYYKYTKILQQSGSSTVAIQAANSVQAIFDIPATVYNLARSKVRFNIVSPPDGATANLFNNQLLDIPPIRRLSLQTRGGKYLFDIQNFQHYWKMCVNLNTEMKEFESYPSAGFSNTIGNAIAAGITNFHNPCQIPNGTAKAAITNNSAKIQSDGTVVNNILSRKQNSSQIQIAVGGANNNAASSLVTMCELDLGKVPFSIFSCDKDFYTTEALQLVVEFEAYNNYLYTSTAVGTNVGAAGILTAVTMNGLELRLAVEQNQAISNAIMSRVMSSGLNMVIPMPYLYRYALGANTNVSVQQKINRGHGQRLLRVISAPSLTADTLNTRCNFYNFDATKLTSFYTTIDSLRQEPEDLNTGFSADHLYIYDKLKNTPFQNPAEYYSQCPSYVNDFSACNSLSECKELDQTINGLNLDAEITWGKMILKPVLDTTENVVIVCQKNLISSAGGVDLV